MGVNEIMRICIFTRNEPAHRDGRATFHQDILGPALVKRGYEVVIITTERADGVRKEERDGMTVYYLEGTPSDIYSQQFWEKSAEKFDELCNMNRFDVVCSESAGAFGWMMFSRYRDKIPLVHIMHNTLSSILNTIPLKMDMDGLRIYISARRRQKLFFNNITKWLLTRADAIICVSRRLAELVKKDFPPCAHKIHVVYNGVDITRFSAGRDEVENLKRKLGLDSIRYILLYIGRISPEKGIEYLIRAMVYVKRKDLKLIIVGYGKKGYVERLDTIIKRLHLDDIIFISGGVSYSEIPVYYKMADIVILPSTGDYEAFPFVIIEAFASQRPVIATRVGGVPEIVMDNINGYIVPPKNFRALARKIDMQLENPELRYRFARHGYSIVCERYTLDRMVTDTENILKNVIGK